MSRVRLDDVQAAPIDKLPVTERRVTVPVEVGDLRGCGSSGPRTRGGDAAGDPVPARRRLGTADIHDRLVRELAVGTGAAVGFVDDDRSPEAHYPVGIEQGSASARWIARAGAANRLDPDRLAVAGDSVGGNLTAALARLAGE